MQIVGFDTDDKTSGGKAKISWLMKDLLSTGHAMNTTITNANGWPATEMRSWLRDTILPTIDSSIRSHIIEVNKTYYDRTDNTTETIADTIWIPSAREMYGTTSYEDSGINYTTLFGNTTRKKKRGGVISFWWLRSAPQGGSSNFRVVNTDGSVYFNQSNFANGVCVGFCTD